MEPQEIFMQGSYPNLYATSLDLLTDILFQVEEVPFYPCFTEDFLYHVNVNIFTFATEFDIIELFFFSLLVWQVPWF